jgi:6-phosphofructokinase 1
VTPHPLPSSTELQVQALGPPGHDSPLSSHDEPFTDEDDRVLATGSVRELQPWLERGEPLPSFERAGPRRRLFFDPRAIACGVVTCGGLCPGLNDVVRAIVLRLHYGYGVRRIFGFRYGYAGLVPRHGHEPVALTPEVVDTVHEHGGTFLGSSRGPQDVGEMVDALERLGLSILFVLGGDGGLRGASAIAGEVRRRGLPIAVVGLPKTIDNDLCWIARSFGFATAVEAARGVIRAAHVEARAAWNGIGLVKVMGRHSGLIAVHATLANNDVNFCLVPEVPLVLEGPGGLFDALARRLAEKHHAVVVVAEGAGQEILQRAGPVERDASGNAKLADVGVFLRDVIAQRLPASGTPVTIRYFDPSYAIRSQPTTADDARYCLALGHHAVHAGMAGRTNVVVAFWNGHFVHVPIPLVTGGRRELDRHGEEWQRLVATTGQGAYLRASA